MSDKNIPGSYNNSGERSANKKSDMSWIESFEKELLKVCTDLLTVKKEDLRKLRAEEIKYCEALLEKLEDVYQFILSGEKYQHNFISESAMDNLEEIAFGAHRRLEALKSHTKEKSAGRPNIQPTLALLIYAALVRADKDRTSINLIGSKIGPQSKLKDSIEKLFGVGSFDGLHIPAPDLNRRWESNVIKSLKRYAWIACFPVETFYEIEMLPKEKRQEEFDEIVGRTMLFGEKLPRKEKTFELPPRKIPIKINPGNFEFSEELQKESNILNGSNIRTILIDRY